MLVSEHQDRQAFHRKAPHDAECVGFAKHKDVSSAEQNREDLKTNHQIQNAMRGTEAAVRVPKPLRKNPVLGDSIQYAIGAHNGRVDRAREHEGTDQGNETAKGDAKR